MRDDTLAWCHVLAAIGLIGAVVTFAGCILPPKLPDVEEEQVPPYIVPETVLPSERIVDITRTRTDGSEPSITLELEARDQNLHDGLFYVFLSNTRGIIQQGFERNFSQEVADDGEIEYFSYRIGVEALPLCTDVPESRVETITVFVADQDFGTISAADPEPPKLIDLGPDGETGHIVSRTWILEYTLDACTQIEPNG
ncbi:MAG: hypothetical protein ACQEVA_04630 [Myxococcota bacterium]